MTKAHGKAIRAGILMVASIMASTPVLTQESTCIVMSEIANAVVESDISIHIRLRGKGIVHMRLDNGCPQLAFHQKFTYQATRGQLCVAQDFVVARSGEFCRIEALDFSDLDSGDDGEPDNPGREPDWL